MELNNTLGCDRLPCKSEAGFTAYWMSSRFRIRQRGEAACHEPTEAQRASGAATMTDRFAVVGYALRFPGAAYRTILGRVAARAGCSVGDPRRPVESRRALRRRSGSRESA